LGKPVALAVNKIDSPKREGLTHEFYSLGFKDLFAVSAEHRIGLDDLLEHVTHGFAEGPAASSPTDAVPKKGSRHSESKAQSKSKSKPVADEFAVEAIDSELDASTHDTSKASDVSRRAVPPIKVAIIGRPNVGKSTLLNAFVGAERAIVSPVAGTTRDAVDETVEHKGVEYAFVDTAGIRRKGKTKLMAEKLSVVMARRHLRMCNVALLVLDASEGMLALDATIAGYAHEEGRAIVVVVNKWDQATMGKRKFAEEVADHLKFLDYAQVAFISAKDREGVMGLYGMIRRAFQSASQRVSTGQLNQFVKTLKWEHGAKIYYMAQVDVRPPKFIAFTDKAQNLHFSAERFLINRLREKFGFEGTPIVLESKRR
jgi:GTPase